MLVQLILMNETKRVADKPDVASNPRRDFLISATNMSWQLAIVVLIPVVGGFKLDEHFKSSPILFIVGFGLAMLGMGLVVWRQLQLLSPKIVASPETKVSKL
jgi:F0F1-type ATP synthase assembly protein I